MPPSRATVTWRTLGRDVRDGSSDEAVTVVPTPPCPTAAAATTSAQSPGNRGMPAVTDPDETYTGGSSSHLLGRAAARELTALPRLRCVVAGSPPPASPAAPGRE